LDDVRDIKYYYQAFIGDVTGNGTMRDKEGLMRGEKDEVTDNAKEKSPCHL
jgi:hypothetical protein